MDNVNGGGDRNNNWVGNRDKDWNRVKNNNRAKDWNRAKDNDWKRNNRDNTWDKDFNVNLEAGQTPPENQNWSYLCCYINEAPCL